MNWNTQILIDFQQGKLDLLYRNVYPGLILYAIKYLGEESEFLAEDCVQNAIFSAWERRNKFDSVYTFKAFLYMAIKNDIISIHRKNSARERYVRELEDVSCFANSVIDQEAQTLLYSAIEELPEKAKIVFEMSFMEGLKNVEIAEKLGLSDSSVKKIQATAWISCVKTRTLFVSILIFRLIEIILKKLQFSIAPFEGIALWDKNNRIMTCGNENGFE